MSKMKHSIIGWLGFLLWAIVLTPRPVFAEGQLAALFEDAVEFNSRNNFTVGAGKYLNHTGDGANDVLFFNLFCEGKAGSSGGTEDVTAAFGKTVNANGGGEVFFDMTICEFCQCAGLTGPEFDACHATNESCATFKNARFAFDPLIGDNLEPDPDFPDGTRVLFNMTEHDPPIDCTGRFKTMCDQGTLDLVHHCTHILDAMGNVLKSISSAYIFSVKS